MYGKDFNQNRNWTETGIVTKLDVLTISNIVTKTDIVTKIT